jgi:hypothetical protein
MKVYIRRNVQSAWKATQVATTKSKFIFENELGVRYLISDKIIIALVMAGSNEYFPGLCVDKRNSFTYN